MIKITCFVFSFSMCYRDISFFLRIILLSQFHFVKIAVTLGQISFSVELSSSETRLISTSSGIVMALALKTKWKINKTQIDKIQ